MQREVVAHDNATTRRLIAAASEEFARHGFASARIRKIVDAARVNLAAVNYYFGGKAGLYRATLGHLARQASRKAAPGRRGHSPETRLHRQVHAILERYIGARRPPFLGRILAHESINPTAHIDRLVEDLMRPELERLQPIVAEIVGASGSESDVAHATAGIMAECLLHLVARPAIERIFPRLAKGPDACEALARQITDFSLDGLERLRARKPAAAEA
jgi:TetR/AcrR family transcriptional regulator, regulator of cefoperazone and chloramphenicol sensitivity